MSLINQALRKAQRDRTPNRMPQAGEATPASYASSAASGMSPALVIGLVIAVAVLIGLVAGLSVVIFKGEGASPSTNATNAVAAPTSPQTQPETLAQSAPTTENLNIEAPQMTPPAAAVDNVEAAPAPSVVEELRKAREAAEAQAAAEAKAAKEAAARAAAKPSEDIIEWLGKARVSGVKISDTESKVILNGKPYSAGEFVNFKLGLKVMIIQEKRVLFVDNNGKKYLKRL